MLSQLTDVKMKAVGIDDKDLRKSVLAAFRKAGYQASPGKVSNKLSSQKAEPSSSMDGGTEAGPSTVQVLVGPLLIDHGIQVLNSMRTNRRLHQRINVNGTVI